MLACADSSAGKETAHKALAELCKIYWRPVFAFICRRGYSVPDAQDLTQDFFLMVLEGQLLSREESERTERLKQDRKDMAKSRTADNNG